MTNQTNTVEPIAFTTTLNPGQLVEGWRQWIVSDIDASSVSPEQLRRNLVKLTFTDEDDLGEEIEFLWKLEPDTHIIERVGQSTFSGMDVLTRFTAGFLEQFKAINLLGLHETNHSTLLQTLRCHVAK